VLDKRRVTMHSTSKLHAQMQNSLSKYNPRTIQALEKIDIGISAYLW